MQYLKCKSSDISFRSHSVKFLQCRQHLHVWEKDLNVRLFLTKLQNLKKCSRTTQIVLLRRKCEILDNYVFISRNSLKMRRTCFKSFYWGVDSLKNIYFVKLFYFFHVNFSSTKFYAIASRRKNSRFLRE